ncbi:MAG: P83/100 family protein [Treponema sp.]
MRKFKCIAIATLLSLSITTAFALEVDEKELQATNGQTIEFENYTGPHAVIDSLAAIKAIGTGLGKTVAADVNKSGTYGSTNGKYYVIHAIDPNQKDKLDADILIVGPNATVDHIKNFRYIIAAYLTAAYGYSEKDASTVATFVTVYNAVYRGKLDNFQAKYKDVVTKNLTAAKCGMSTKWSEWAGNSQIVIPLSDLNGGLSTVDTSVISDKQVVQSMKEEDNKGVDERKNMVDIKEREADTATEKAQTAQKTATEENKKATDQQKKADTAKKEADTAKKEATTAKKEADTAKKEAEKNPQDTQKKQAAEEKKQVAEEKQQTAEQKETAAEKEQTKADEQKETAQKATDEAATQQEKADKKQAEAQAERTEIAKDHQKILEDALAEAANKNAVIGLKMTDNAKEMSGMVKVDSVTGEIIRESPVTYIRGRTILTAGKSTNTSTSTTTETKANTNNKETTNDNTEPTSILYMAICGENTGNGTVKLCLLDGNKMEIQQESNEVIAENSVLVQNGSDYYCVIQNEKAWFVGKYDSTLKLLLKSTVAVTPETPITVTPNGLIVTNENGKVILLKLEDLSPIQTPSAEK